MSYADCPILVSWTRAQVNDEAKDDSMTTAKSRLAFGRGPTLTSWAALACSLVGLPLCLWLFSAMMVEFGPDWAFQALVQAHHDRMRLAISMAQDAGLLLAVVGTVLGVVVLVRGRRREGSPRAAVIAAYLGAAGVLAFAVGFIGFALGMWAMFIFDTSGRAIMLAGVTALILLECVLFLIARRSFRKGGNVTAS